MSYLIPTLQAIPTHSGFEATSRTNLGDGIVISAELKAFPISTLTIGRANFGAITITALKIESYLDILYNQIWMNPRQIDAGIISSDKYYDFYIWNAYMNEEKTITEVTLYGLDNIDFTDNILRTLKPTEELTTQIKIKLSGRAQLNGFINITISGTDYKVYITGCRIIPLPLAYFLSNTYQLRHSYFVAITSTMNLKEQRRLLVDKCLREISSEVLINKLSRTKALNYFDYLGGLFCGIAIPHEKMTPTANDLYGLTEIYVNEDISLYKELQNSTLIMIVNINTNDVELCQIDSIDISQKKITLQRAVVNHFYKNTTEIFPALICIVKEVSNVAKVGNYTVANITASEVYQ